MHRIDEVLAKRLCAGCGACAYIAGDRGVEMVDHPGVGRRPVGVESLPLFVKDQIADVCPGSRVEAPGWQGHEPTPDEVVVGPAEAIWEGWASDEEIRWAGSSGGVVTALAAHALERRGMALVVHTGMDPGFPWQNRTVVSTSRTELVANSSSRYAPSSPVESLGLIEASDQPCVFIGKPCDVAAVSRLRRTRPRLDRNLGLVLSFFCAGTPASSESRQVAVNLGMPGTANMTSLRYRGRGWPGDFVAQDDTGLEVSTSYDESWAQLARGHRQLRCNLCPDGLGELADVTGGDAWHRHEQGNPGISLILARTERGRDAVLAAVADGYLEVTASDHSRVVAAQGLVQRRRLLGARLAALRTLALPVPQFPGFELRRAAAQAGMARRTKEYMGTLRRALQRGFLGTEPRR